jgi:hypothetical protein
MLELVQEVASILYFLGISTGIERRMIDISKKNFLVFANGKMCKKRKYSNSHNFLAITSCGHFYKSVSTNLKSS